MFCKKCGDVINDGEELCQACSEKQQTVDWSPVKNAAKEAREKVKKIGKEVMDSSMKEVQKAVKKKANQTTNILLKKMRLKKETPLDKAKDMWKMVKR